MRKVIALAAAVVFAVSTFGYAQTTGAKDAKPAAAEAKESKAAATAAAPADAKSITVYVTESGKAYHRQECAAIKDKKTNALTLEAAVKQEYTPCGKCWPEVIVYTAKDDACYHNADCKKLGKEKTALTLEQAGAAKLAACPECKPEIEVYVTDTGKSYHAYGCRMLNKSTNTMWIEDAVAKEYKPCGICKPPVYEAPKK